MTLAFRMPCTASMFLVAWLIVVGDSTASAQTFRSVVFKHSTQSKLVSLGQTPLGVGRFPGSIALADLSIPPGAVSSYFTPTDEPYVPWEARKHFWVGAGEIAVLEFIPWALARWIRPWEDPADNWAKVSPETWWRNISMGWEYDGDNFLTNNFSHPYHGALFFNAGRTNGYDFWESTAWSLTGSALWEYFGETFRPAFNDWIYTGVGGANLGEMLYRLSTLVTDNRATGSDRLWSEVFGTLINPVRGFTRLVSGEMGRNFDNPAWRTPEDFLITFDAGTRVVDKNGDKEFRDKELEGLFSFNLSYGSPFKAREPFSAFSLGMAIASGEPHFTRLASSGYLFGWQLERNKHRLNVNLDFSYNNLIKDFEQGVDSTYRGFLYGEAAIDPHLLSRFPIGEKTSIVTRVGISLAMMSATPNDYYVDVEGRIYDFGPGVGTNLAFAIRGEKWDYVTLRYRGGWLWTQTEPSDSKHHIHVLALQLQYPLTPFFVFGVDGGVYWRESYYEHFPNVYRDHPFVRVFFKTAVIDL